MSKDGAVASTRSAKPDLDDDEVTIVGMSGGLASEGDAVAGRRDAPLARRKVAKRERTDSAPSSAIASSSANAVHVISDEDDDGNVDNRRLKYNRRNVRPTVESAAWVGRRSEASVEEIGIPCEICGVTIALSAYQVRHRAKSDDIRLSLSAMVWSVGHGTSLRQLRRSAVQCSASSEKRRIGRINAVQTPQSTLAQQFTAPQCALQVHGALCMSALRPADADSLRCSPVPLPVGTRAAIHSALCCLPTPGTT